MAAKIDRRRREYPINLIQEVRRMFEGGWTVSEIHELLEGRGGEVPSKVTMYFWVNPKRAERAASAHRRRQAEKSAANGKFTWPGARSPEWMVGRIQFLAAIGISHPAIAKVMNADFGLAMDDHQVRRVVLDGAWPQAFRQMRNQRAVAV